MNRVLYTILLCCYMSIFVIGQPLIEVDAPLQCPHFRSPVITGGQFLPGCPPAGYIYIPHMIDYEGNYEYSVNGGSTWQSSPYFGNLNRGSYNVKMRLTIGSQSCIEDYPSNPVQLNYKDFAVQVYHNDIDSMEQRGKLIIDTVLVSQPATCSNTGTIEVKLIQNISGTYEYSLDGQNFQPQRFFYNMPVGKYTVFVRKLGSNCPVAYRRELNLMPGHYPSFLGILNNWGCQKGELRIILNDMAGVSCSIDGGVTWQNDAYFPNLDPGYYYPRVKKNNCIMIPPDVPFAGINNYKPQVLDLSFNPGPCNGLGTISCKLYLPFLKGLDGGINLKVSYDGTNYTQLDIQNLPNVQIGVPVKTTRIYVKVILGSTECIYYFDIPSTTGKLTTPVINKVQPSCLLANGSITITAQDNGSYEYSIDNGLTWHSSATFSGLSPGEFKVCYRNIPGTCFSDTVKTDLVNQNIPPVITGVIKNNITNCGLTDGKITINATPGTGATFYSINNGAAWQSSNIFNNLGEGDYNIKIKNDNNSCEVVYGSNPIHISKPIPPAFVSVAHTNVTDCGLIDGTISITATPGSSGLQYSINGGGTWQTTATYSGLAGGSYNIRIRNNDATCEVIYGSNPIIITTPIAPTLNSVTFDNTTDCNVNNATITINATPGSAALRYSIDNGNNWFQSGSFSGLAPADYTIKIKNADNTCIVNNPTNPLHIPGHTAPSITDVQVEDVSDCGMNDGQITVLATAGEGNIQYSINNGTTWSSSSVFSNLSAGNYQVKIRNNNGTCAVSFLFNPVEIIAPQPPAFISVSHTNVTDCGLSNGTITIEANPGSSALQYSINNGVTWQSSKQFNNLSAGPYLVAIRNVDATCRQDFAQNPVAITSPIPPVINSVDKTDVSDCSVTDGTIAIHASPGSSALKYSIDNGSTWSDNSLFTGLSHGTYYVYVKNADNTCSVGYGANPIVIKAPSAPAITGIAVEPPTTCVNPRGKITIEYAIGSGMPQFTIDGGVTWSSNNIYSNLSPGTYYVGIRNMDGSCASINTSPTIIEALPWPQITDVQVEGLIGCSSGTATITILAQGSGSLDLRYSIDDGVTWHLSNTFPGLMSGNYNIMVKYETNVCVVEYNNNPIFLQRTPDPIVQNVVKTDPTSCTNQQSGSIQLQASDPSGLSLSYSINNGTNWQSGSIFNNLESGVYFVAVKNNLGCIRYYDANPIQLNAPSQPIITTVDSIHQPGCKSSDGSFTIRYTNSLPVEFSINNGATWVSTPQFNNMEAGNYYLKIRNADGNCENAYLYNPFKLEEQINFAITQVTVVNPTGCHTEDGSITIFVQPANTYEYSIDGGNQWSLASTFENLSQGSYGIKVRLPNTACILSYSSAVTIKSQSAPVIKEVSIYQPSCGQSDGKIVIETSSTGTIEYSIDRGDNWQSSGTFTDLAAGIFFPVIRFAQGDCYTYADSVVLLSNTPVEIWSVVVKDNTNCENANGQITIAASSSDVLYSIDGGNTWQPQPYFDHLPEGQYRIQVKHTPSGCIAIYPGIVHILSVGGASILGYDFLSTDNCSGLQAFISIYSIDADNYSIDGGLTWTADSIFQQLDTGTYQIAVQKGSCITRGDSLMFLPLAEVKVVDVTTTLATSCFQNDGSISIIANPLENVDSYSIDGGLSFFDKPMFDSLYAGVYSPLIKNKNGCLFGASPTTIYANGDLKINSVETIQPTLCTSSDGRIIIHPLDTARRLYSIDRGLNWQEDTLFNDLKAGEYTVLYKEKSDSCVYSLSTEVVLSGKNTPQISAVVITTSDSCKSGHSVLQVESTGENLLYSIDNGGHWTSTPIFSGLSDGPYIIATLDSLSGCSGRDTAVYVYAGAPNISDSIDKADVTTCSIKDGRITIRLTPGRILRYSINNGENFQQSNDFTNLAPGSYLVVVEDVESGCRSETKEIRIGWQGFDPDAIVLKQRDAFCDNSGVIYTEGNYPGLSFSINEGLTWQTVPNFKDLAAGTYSVTIKGSNTCLYKPGIPVIIGKADTLSYSATVETPTCRDMDNGKITVTLDPDQDDETIITWPDGTHGKGIVGAAGAYTILFRYKECSSSATIYIPESTQPNIEWTPVKDTFLCTSPQVAYDFTEYPYDFTWKYNRKEYFGSKFLAGAGEVLLFIRDTAGCLRQDQWKIDISADIKDLDFLLPTEGLVGYNIIAADISNPIPDSIRWTIDSTNLSAAQSIDNQLFLIYNHSGSYPVRADIWSGDCHVRIIKYCTVFATADSLTIPIETPNNNTIQAMSVYPSPNNGIFKILMEYSKPEPGMIHIYDQKGNRIYSQQVNPTFNIEVFPMELNNAESGIHSAVYQSMNGETRWRNFIIIK